MPYYERVCIGQDCWGNDIYQQVEIDTSEYDEYRQSEDEDNE